MVRRFWPISYHDSAYVCAPLKMNISLIFSDEAESCLAKQEVGSYVNGHLKILDIFPHMSGGEKGGLGEVGE